MKIRPPDMELAQALVREALMEDGYRADVTTRCLDISGRDVRAQILAREDGVIAGQALVGLVFGEVDPGLVVRAVVADGERVGSGATVAALEGDAASILAGERVALNFLQRLSGIATLTSAYVAAVAGRGVRILDTRKTTPLHRELERYAVRVGGGHNHRFNLTDMVLVKENHVRAAGGLEAVLCRLSAARPGVPVEVEVDSPAAFRAVLGAAVDRIMLDNFSPDDIAAAIEELRQFQRDRAGFDPEIEVSGGVTLDNVRAHALPGVDFVSVGALTHSVRSLDISMEVT